MKCLACGRWGKILCPMCLPPLSLGTRLVDEMSVHSFYALSEIELLLHYKYTPIGSRIFSLLALRASEFFCKEFGGLQGLKAVGIDDGVKKGYSHTGVILHSFKRCGITPIYGELRARNQVSYAGKSLEYRKQNPKNFSTKLKDERLILFDDVITTGTSLKEAKALLQSLGNQTLFALTLCDARR